MSANPISWRRIKRLNADLGERFVHCSTSSTGDWWVWHCIRPDGSAVYVDTRSGELRASSVTTTTQRLLRTRETLPLVADEGWLAELDRRIAEVGS